MQVSKAWNELAQKLKCVPAIDESQWGTNRRKQRLVLFFPLPPPDGIMTLLTWSWNLVLSFKKFVALQKFNSGELNLSSGTVERQEAGWDYEREKQTFSSPRASFLFRFKSACPLSTCFNESTGWKKRRKKTFIFFYIKLALATGTLPSVGSEMIWEGVWCHGSWQRRQVFYHKNK